MCRILFFKINDTSLQELLFSFSGQFIKGSSTSNPKREEEEDEEEEDEEEEDEDEEEEEEEEDEEEEEEEEDEEEEDEEEEEEDTLSEFCCPKHSHPAQMPKIGQRLKKLSRENIGCKINTVSQNSKHAPPISPRHSCRATCSISLSNLPFIPN